VARRTASVSGNSVDRPCFRILFLICDVSSAGIHGRLSRSAAIVTQLVTRSPVSMLPVTHGSGGGKALVRLAAPIVL
jgi:hypothetical protein